MSCLDWNVIESIRELQDTDPDVLRSVVCLFLESLPERTEKLRVALEKRDAPAVHQNAHSLKSSSANLGAVELSKICGELEERGRGGQFAGTDLLWQRFVAESSEVVKELKALPEMQKAA